VGTLEGSRQTYTCAIFLLVFSPFQFLSLHSLKNCSDLVLLTLIPLTRDPVTETARMPEHAICMSSLVFDLPATETQVDHSLNQYAVRSLEISSLTRGISIHTMILASTLPRANDSHVTYPSLRSSENRGIQRVQLGRPYGRLDNPESYQHRSTTLSSIYGGYAGYSYFMPTYSNFTYEFPINST
jgi:hypothetical protein